MQIIVDVLQIFILVLSFFFMQRPPPSSTLFPYTTLFRSLLFGWEIIQASGDGRVTELASAVHQNFLPFGQRRLVGQDRKSTRLNSSHRTISYAVFCLKKKNLMVCESGRNYHAQRQLS